MAAQDIMQYTNLYKEKKTMLNKILLTGRLTTRPELKTTTNGANVTQFSLAVQRNFKNGNGEYGTDFINCVAWRNQAEFITKHFDKGQLITVVGSLTSRKYEDNEGNKRTVFEVLVEETLFAESKKSSENTPNNSSMNISSPGGNATEFEEVTDEELPF